MPTLSFYEYLRLVGIDAPKLPPGLAPAGLLPLPPAEAQAVMTKCLPLREHFHRYLLAGGFPEVAGIENLAAAQRHTPPVDTAVMLATEPLFAAIIAVALGGEQVTARMVLGGGMIFAAMLLAVFSPAAGGKDGDRTSYNSPPWPPR